MASFSLMLGPGQAFFASLSGLANTSPNVMFAPKSPGVRQQSAKHETPALSKSGRCAYAFRALKRVTPSMNSCTLGNCQHMLSKVSDLLLRTILGKANNSCDLESE